MTADQYIKMLRNRRYYNLRRIVDMMEPKIRLAKKACMDEARVSNILNEHLSITEVRARKIEQFLGLEYGFLDRETDMNDKWLRCLQCSSDQHSTEECPWTRIRLAR